LHRGFEELASQRGCDIEVINLGVGGGTLMGLEGSVKLAASVVAISEQLLPILSYRSESK